jgi:single-strand DNA-binding protein
MKTIGLARLGRDAELRYMPDGTPVANLALAVNYGKRGEDGNRPTQWIDASLWGKAAESLAEFMVKGSLHCFTLSDIHIETYEGRNGTGYKLVARVDGVELGPRPNEPQGQQAPAQRQAPQQRQQAQQGNSYANVRNGAAPPPQQPARQAPPLNTGSGFDDMDDIPFN